MTQPFYFVIARKPQADKVFQDTPTHLTSQVPFPSGGEGLGMG